MEQPNPDKRSRRRVVEKRYTVMLETEVNYHVKDFDGEWPSDDDLIVVAMAHNHVVNISENGYVVASAQLAREIVRYD